MAYVRFLGEHYCVPYVTFALCHGNSVCRLRRSCTLLWGLISEAEQSKIGWRTLDHQICPISATCAVWQRLPCSIGVTICVTAVSTCLVAPCADSLALSQNDWWCVNDQFQDGGECQDTSCSARMQFGTSSDKQRLETFKWSNGSINQSLNLFRSIDTCQQ